MASVMPDLQVTCHSKTRGMSPYDILAVGCMDGSVLIFKYPILYDQSEYIRFKAHTSPVVSLCFTLNNDYLITVGKDDGCIVRWSLKDEELD